MNKGLKHWGLTPGEKRAVLLICVASFIGLSYRLYQRYTLSEFASVSAEDSVAVEAIRSAYSSRMQDRTESKDQYRAREVHRGKPDVGTVGVGLLNLNTASKKQLEELPGIGPVLAGRIIETRERLGEFTSPDDLLAVPGIGHGKLKTIEPLICCLPFQEEDG